MLWNVLGILGPSGVWVYADGSGDYPTIEAAVADIPTGTTINLGPGIFSLSETLTVDFSFNLVGSGMDGPDSTVVTCTDTVVDVYSVSFSAQDIHFMTTGSGAPTDVMDAGDATIDLQRCGFSGAVRWNDHQGDGLYLYGTATATVTDCVFTLNDLHGVEVDEDAEVTLENNFMYDNGENGITFWANSFGVVSGNECTENGLNGISVNDDAEVTVENNLCSGNEYTGIRFSEYASGTIRNNECSDNVQEDGIGLYDDSSADGREQPLPGQRRSRHLFRGLQLWDRVRQRVCRQQMGPLRRFHRDPDPRRQQPSRQHLRPVRRKTSVSAACPSWLTGPSTRRSHPWRRR